MRAAKLFFLGLVTITAASCGTTQSNGGAVVSALVGTWHQVEAECGSAEPMSELIFEPNGHYSVTWLPFETYKDYWGAWRYNARTQVLTLTVDGGNYQPTDRVLEGAVRADAHQLALGAISLGSPQHGARCAAAFRR